MAWLRQVSSWAFVLGGFLLLAGVITARQGSAQSQDREEEAFTPGPSRIAAGTAQGRARLVPNSFDVASVGDYRLRFTIGASGIQTGGGILVDFPKAWFTNPFPLTKPLQQIDPDAPHYLSVESSRAGVRLSLEIDRLSRVGKTERFRQLMIVEVQAGELSEGDEIVVTYANTTSPHLTGTGEVAVAVDARGDGRYRMIASGARYEVFSGAGVEVMLFAPSQAVVGQPIELQLTSFDEFHNVAETMAGILQVSGLDDEPILAAFGSVDRGTLRLRWTPREAGYYWPQVSGTMLIVKEGGLYPPLRISVQGGPIHVYASEPEHKIYWGDLHSHSGISKDATGSGDFEYARDVTRLDFFASTEHADDDGRPLADGITRAEWTAIQDKVRGFHEPGRFVTLLAYECSMGGGHHNVYFRSLAGVPWPARAVGGVGTLWEKLEAGTALTIPHHLGIQWGTADTLVTGPGLQEVRTAAEFHPGGPQLDWTLPQNQELRPALEIYSKHGQSEHGDPADSLSYEQVKYTAARSIAGRHYARDAWAAGHRLGVVSGSDNHSAHPGLTHTGLTAVFAGELTREAIFDALASRRTYATTGQRILLEFELAGSPMGSVAGAEGKVKGEVTVAAPGEIQFAEVWGLGLDSGDWAVVIRWDDPGRFLQEEFEVSIDGGTAVYYLRVGLKDQHGNRDARAWSSPIWIEPR